MFFDSFSDFIAMGTHGPYVWLCYGIFALTMIYNFVGPRLKRKQVLKDIARQIRREDA